ncbi:hypothetical protein ACLMJK_008993 [Lecanora helva]
MDRPVTRSVASGKKRLQTQNEDSNMAPPSKNPKLSKNQQVSKASSSGLSKTSNTLDTLSPSQAEASETGEPTTLGTTKSKKKYPGPSQARKQNIEKYAFPQGPPVPMPGTDVRIDDQYFKDKLCLSWSDEERQRFLASLPIKRLRRLEKSDIDKCSPEGLWIAETRQDFDFYSHHMATRTFADKRPANLHQAVHLAQKSKWKRIVEVNESVILMEVDESGDDVGIFGVVIREFIEDSEVLEHAHNIARKCLEMSRDNRRDDMGIMVQHGYSVQKTKTGLEVAAPNNVLKSHDARELSLQQHALVSMQSLIWNVALKKVPREVIQRFESAMDQTLRDDWNLKKRDNHPISNISFKAGDIDLELSGLELGPPSGLCFTRYARYIHKDHHQEPCHDMMTLTTSRTAPPAYSGNFIFAEFGVLVQEATNTFISYRADMLHGNTLHSLRADTDKRPKASTGAHEHCGFSMYVSNRLKTPYQAWLRKELEKQRENQPLGGSHEPAVDLEWEDEDIEAALALGRGPVEDFKVEERQPSATIHNAAEDSEMDEDDDEEAAPAPHLTPIRGIKIEYPDWHEGLVDIPIQSMEEEDYVAEAMEDDAGPEEMDECYDEPEPEPMDERDDEDVGMDNTFAEMLEDWINDL